MAHKARKRVGATATDESPTAAEGWVYAAVNDAMPGLVKVGRTTQDDPKKRLKDLYTTGVPCPFVLIRQLRVRDPARVESLIFRILSCHRVSDNREFLRVDIDQIAAVFELMEANFAVENPQASKDDLDYPIHKVPPGIYQTRLPLRNCHIGMVFKLAIAAQDG